MHVKKKGVKLAVNYWRRWDIFHSLVTKMLNTGKVGKPYVFDCRSHVGLMNCGTHLIDLALMYSDEDPMSVSGNIFDDGSADPGACGIIKFKSGRQAFIDCAWKENPRLGINVRGDKGTLFAMTNEVLLAGCEIDTGKSLQKIMRAANSPMAPMSYALENILECIKDDIPLLSPGTMAVKSLEVAVAFYASHETGHAISVPIKNKDYKNRQFACRITSMTKNGKILEEWKKIMKLAINGGSPVIENSVDHSMAKCGKTRDLSNIGLF